MNYFHVQIVNLRFMSVNQEFKRTINRIKYEHSINQSQIAEKLGVTKPYLSDMINSRVPYNEVMKKKISDVFGTQEYEDNSDISKESIVKQERSIEISASDIKEDTFIGTPVYDIDGTCGTDERDMQFTDDSIIGSIDLPGISKSAKIITANGDSMEPVVHDGSKVVLREIFSWIDIFYGQIYLVLMEEYRMIKYIRKYEKDEENYVILRSENPKYDDMRIHKDKIRKLFIVENILSVKNQI